MSKPVAFRKSDLKAAIQVAESRGWTGVKLTVSADGSISVTAAKIVPPNILEHKDASNAVED
jgi:hypothetical protein